MPSISTFLLSAVLLLLFFGASLFIKLKLQGWLKAQGRSAFASEIVSDLVFVAFFAYCLLISTPYMYGEGQLF